MTIRAGPKPRGRVSRRAIVEKALEIADREGVEGLTFRRLASELDVTAMALYRHVQDKSDLLSAMGDAVLAEITVSPGLERDWAERLRAYLRAVYAALDNHPAAGALIARPLVSPAAMRITETLLATLQGGGFTPAQSVRLIQVLTGMILGPVVLAAGYGALLGENSETAAKERASYDDFIGRLADGEYPVLMSVLPEMLEWPSSTELRDAAVDVLVEGLKALAAARRLPAP